MFEKTPGSIAVGVGMNHRDDWVVQVWIGVGGVGWIGLGGVFGSGSDSGSCDSKTQCPQTWSAAPQAQG